MAIGIAPVQGFDFIGAPTFWLRTAMTGKRMEKTVPNHDARRHDLDALRAFAMLLGIVFHAALPYSPWPWMVGDWKKNDLLIFFLTWVHGFRMPLFIFVSGYFTRMMWRRRGLTAVLKQRFLRVFLPLLLGTLTLLPLQDWIVTWANARASSQDAQRFSQPGIRSDVVNAIRTNDLATLKKLLDAGADPNQSDPEFKSPALSWSAHCNNAAAARLLIEKGADVNRPSPGGHRALHSAAYFAHPAVLEVLLDHGADPSLSNDGGEIPAVAATKKWDEVKGVAGYLRLAWSQTEPEFQTAREQCRQLLSRQSGSAAQKANAAGATENALTRSRTAYREFLTSDRFLVPGKIPGRSASGTGSWHLIYTSIFDHLWFLWYLCWLVGFFGVFTFLADRLRIPTLPSRWLLAPTWAFWLIPVTMIPQLWMGVFGAGFGPDTSVGLIPQPHLLLYYGIFFGAGALYFESNDTQNRLGRRIWLLLPLATFVLLPAGLATVQSHPLLSGVLQVAFAWSMSFGLIGLFSRYLKSENPTIRYLADSAYWLYLAHHPLVALFQSGLRPWDAPALLKWLVLCVGLILVLLLSYALLVRHTWLGTLLNGPRDRRAPAKAGA